MSKNSFKIDNSLVLRPTTAPANPENGEIYFDQTLGKLRKYENGAFSDLAPSGGSSAELPSSLLVQTFEDAVLGDFVQTGLVLDTSNPLNGTVSARLTHQAVGNQSFKQTFAVPEIFRNKNVTFKLTVKSAAAAGDVRVTIIDVTNTVTLVDAEAVQITNAAGGVQSSISFDMPATCASLSYEVVALPEAGSPITRVDDISIELTNLSAVQNVLVQEEDSVVRLDTANGYGSTATRIRRFANIRSQIGNSIRYEDSPVNGSSFTVLEDGVYSVAYSDNFNAASDLGISINSNQLTTNIQDINPANRLAIGTTGAANQSDVIAWTGYLLKDDVIRAHSTATPTGVDATRTNFTITKQGSLKQVTTNPNQKIEIPTSELRMEGASTRGSTATSIVRFDTVAKLSGDAFTVESDAVLGTRITIRKRGMLNISSTLVSTNNGTFITRNQSNLTIALGLPSSEYLAVNADSTTQGRHNAAWSGVVNPGDILRVAATANPLADNNNSLNLFFQEQEIQVSVSNTLPQFSESDSSVRVDTANGYGSTGTRIRRFSNVRDNIGSDIEYVPSAVNGDSFVVKSAGTYNISYTENFNSANFFGITKNANTDLAQSVLLVSDALRLASGTASDSAAGRPNTVAWEGVLQAGDIIRAHINDNVAANTNGRTSFTISKVGKPNVTGVDVTPFVEIPQPTQQSAYLALASVAGTSSITGPLTTSVGSGIFSYNPTTGVYTMLKKALVTATGNGLSGGARFSPTISIDGQSRAFDTTESVNTAAASSAYTDILLPGQTILFTNGGGGTGNTIRVNVTAEALSDQILTEPETFSTDTAPLTYAPSTTYTLTTLANAPVGTYITFTYAANTNTRTQTTVRPTQTDADMNTNGIQIFTRAYNASSTATEPAAVAIQIGKGLKGRTLDLYKSAGKSVAGSTDYYLVTNTGIGIRTKEYNENTGVLIVDSGFQEATATSGALFNFSDNAQQANGYLVINASKNPALTGLQKPKVVAASYWLSADQALTASVTDILYNSKEFDTDGLFNTSNGRFTAQEPGFYEITGSYDVSAASNATLYKNGIAQKRIGGTTSAAAGALSGLVYLAQGDYVTIRSNTSVTVRGSASLSTNASNINFKLIK